MGESLVLAQSLPGEDGGVWPTCNTATDFRGYKSTADEAQLLEWMKVDLDVRTIGTLVEMDASAAAYDVYHWGMHSRDLPNEASYSLQDIALGKPFHVKNTAAAAYEEYFAETNSASATTSFEDLHEYSAMMGTGDFAGGSDTQRRIITEGSIVAITLHVAALDLMYQAVDSCRENSAETTWDRAFAYLSGWAEETDDASGFLMMDIARFLCRAKGKCLEETNDSIINKSIVSLMEIGKAELAKRTSQSCDVAEEKVEEVKRLILTILVDATAYFLEKLAADKTNLVNLAESCELAACFV